MTRWQIQAKNPDQCAEFYSKLFGWEVNTANALSYRMVDTCSERGITGGVWPVPEEAQSGVTLFVEVEDLASSVEQAQALGAKVLIPPQALPDGDSMAMVMDTEGIPLGLFTPAG